MRDSRLQPRPRSDIIKGGEEAEDRKRMRRMANNQKNSIPVADDDLVVRQILSRLPAKCLMRFKCVSKAWKSIIELDSEFINLHYAHSQARSPGLLMVPSGKRPPFFSAELHFADDDSDGGRKISGATIHRLGGGRTVESSGPIVRFSGPVRGLLCLYDKHYAVRIYNVTTCQAVTPWIRPAHVMPWCPDRCQFGFDPSTGTYKVVFLLDYPEAVCEVLTVGVDASWRRIDQVPPYKPCGDFSAYANGSIYWITYTGPLVPRDEIDYPSEEHREYFMAFDVGSEKFRMIRIPSFTFWGYNPFPYCGLFEMDGCLTVVRGRRLGAEYHTVKMWKFHDYGKLHGTNGTSSPIGAEQDWSEVTIKLPRYDSRDCSFSPVPGKDLMIVKFRNPPHSYDSQMAHAKIPSYYSYNMINKTLSRFEVEGTSLLRGTGLELCAIFAECLFSGTGNLTYTAPSVSPVPPQNVPGAIYPWSSSPSTHPGGYHYPAPYIHPVPPRNVLIAVYPSVRPVPPQNVPGAIYDWSLSPPIPPVPPQNVPIAFDPWSLPPTRQGFLPPQVGQVAIAPRGFQAGGRYLPPNHPNEQYVEDDWSLYDASSAGGRHI